MSKTLAASGPQAPVAAKPRRFLGRFWGRFWARFGQILGLILALYVVEQDVEMLLWHTGALPGAGELGAQMTPDTAGAPGVMQVEAVKPGSPLAKAGVAAGDHLRFARMNEDSRRMMAGDEVQLSIEHKTGWQVMTVIAMPKTPADQGMAGLITLLGGVTCLINALFGAFILLRSQMRPATVLLGLALTCFGLAVVFPQMWESRPAVFGTFLWLNLGIFTVIPALFLWFSMQFVEETVGGVTRRAYGLFGVYAALTLASGVIFGYGLTTGADLPVFGKGYLFSFLINYFGFFVSLYCLVTGYLKSVKETQKRYSLFLVAISAVILSKTIVYLVYLIFYGHKPEENPLLVVANLLSGIAPALFAYSIFRQKVFDLGFAINRTLVYGAVSAILLVAFGIAEWAIEHFLPFKSHEAGVLIDAGLALGLFLIFHRLEAVVEGFIEKLFFHRWQTKEAELRRFVRESVFVLKTDPLLDSFLAELKRFSDGAEAALYLKDEGGQYTLREGRIEGMNPGIDPDTPEIVRLRASRIAVEPDEIADATLKAALLMPMVQRSDLTGFVAMGAKPDGTNYRPDEIEVLSYATHQIGLDLHALKVEQLQQRVSALDIELKALKTMVLHPKRG